MKSRINQAWFKDRAKDVCKDCTRQMNEFHQKELERAVREGFKAGIGVALKSKELFQGYGAKRLQRDLDDMKRFGECKPFNREIEFNAIEDNLRKEYGINISDLEISVDVKPAEKNENNR